ncbi:hypothetical protein EVAR_7514_1 [Eumeta japonica]|uniref:Uncharacterized protein n=1 Tax=Eumeta variegata TaxID=151549 RepID=A0A4C2A8X7_EUMVA|nr:hypothetical protein EVAR_7514_1 [Eumeta japonica]
MNFQPNSPERRSTFRGFRRGPARRLGKQSWDRGLDPPTPARTAWALIAGAADGLAYARGTEKCMIWLSLKIHSERAVRNGSGASRFQSFALDCTRPPPFSVTILSSFKCLIGRSRKRCSSSPYQRHVHLKWRFR